MKGRKILWVGLACLACLAGQAQKRPLDARAYSRWQRVADPDISDDGKWVSYRIAPQNSGAEDKPVIYLYSAEKKRTFRLERAEEPLFFANGKWLRYVVRDTAAGGCDTTWLLRLRDMKKVRWKHREAFSPVWRSDLITWQYPLPDGAGKPGAFKRLVIRNMTTGDTLAIDSLYNYVFFDHNRSIIFQKKMNGYRALYAGPLGGPYRPLHDYQQEHVSSFTYQEEIEGGTFSVQSDSLIYGYSLKDGKVDLLFRRSDIDLPAGMRAGGLTLSKDRSYVTYELRPQVVPPDPPLPEKDDSFELQLWTWNEEIPPSRQEIDGLRRRPGYPKYVYYLATRQSVKLADAGEVSWPESAGGGKYVFVLDERPYRKYMDRRENLHCDIWAVDRFTGARKLLFADQARHPVWGPGGKYALIYESQEKQWYKFDARTGEVSGLTQVVGLPFYQEDHDKPCPPDPYGVAGWLPGGDRVLLNDRYDWWLFDLEDRCPPQCYTRGYGRGHEMSIRLLRSNFDPQVIDIRTPLLVEFFRHADKSEGIGRLLPGGKLQVLTEGNYKYTVHKLSDDRKFCIFTRQNYRESRDLWWSATDFASPRRLTAINPQQSEYLWGEARLVNWTNGAGKTNQGVLYLPEGYDSTRVYPTLVQFYETHSDALNVYPAPAFSMAMADVPTYVSNGYVVFMPDVHFMVGNPGQSSYDAVVSGVRMLIGRKIADPARIGLQGHSWSGFQAAYLVAHSDLFRCANIGAPITDMVSGYVGIRKGSGLVRFFMYEDTQSRMGKSLWEAKEAYLSHSPLLEADKITAPLLIFHCDNDEAVAYEQGRALYLAMRRLGKPAWLLNYKGDGHFLGNEAAQRDWTIRMQQFFDYYLKDAPEPRWMKEGINIHERGRDQKYDYVK